MLIASKRTTTTLKINSCTITNEQLTCLENFFRSIYKFFVRIGQHHKLNCLGSMGNECKVYYPKTRCFNSPAIEPEAINYQFYVYQLSYAAALTKTASICNPSIDLIHYDVILPPWHPCFLQAILLFVLSSSV